MTKVVYNGQMVDCDGAVMLMDGDTRETVHSTFAGDTDQEFIDAYAASHLAKFGEEFVVN